MVEDTKGVKRLIDRLESGKDTLRCFVVNRHEEGRARCERRPLLQGRQGNATDATATPQRQKPYEPIDEWQSDPDKVDGEDDQQSHLEHRHAAYIEDLIHLIAGGGGEDKCGSKHYGASASGVGAVLIRPRLTTGMPSCQILCRHMRCRLIRDGPEGWPGHVLLHRLCQRT